MELANELRMSKVVQLRAAIAPRGFVLPKYLNLMSSDAGNRAPSAGLMIVLAGPDDAVAQRQPTSHCGIHDDAPRIDLLMKDGSTGGRSGTARPFPLWRLRSGPCATSINLKYSDVHQSKIFGSGISIMSPRARIPGRLTSCRLVSSPRTVSPDPHCPAV
jgi:hypothetical protein